MGAEEYVEDESGWGPNPTVVMGIATGIAVVCVVLVIAVRFYPDQSIGKKPPKPETKSVTLQEVNQTQTGTSEDYVRILERDAGKMGLPTPDPAIMQKVFKYRSETESFKLKKGSSKNVAGLELKLTKEGRGSDETMVLEVTNRTSGYLTYKVATRPSHGTQVCQRKTPIAHNAVILAPKKTIRRSECRYRKGWFVHVDSVETLEIPEISAAYLSQVHPVSLGLDKRSTRDHLNPWKTNCVQTLMGELQGDVNSGEIPWHNLVDFFARHNCKRYSYVRSYTPFTEPNEHQLPYIE